MKIIVAVIAAAASIAWVSPDAAEAQSRERGARAKAVKAQPARVAARSASVGQNGLCQRDTGTPADKLNFRNPCDVEEFWRRIMDRGAAGER